MNMPKADKTKYLGEPRVQAGFFHLDIFCRHIDRQHCEVSRDLEKAGLGAVSGMACTSLPVAVSHPV